MAQKDNSLRDIAEYLPGIMRKLFGGRLVISKAWELTIPQLRALKFIVDNPACTMSDLAQHLGIRLNAATGLADRLVQNDLLTREADPADRRLVRLRLTKSGVRAQEACRRERQRMIDEALQQLSNNEQEQIAAALMLLYNALDSPGANAVSGKDNEQGG